MKRAPVQYLFLTFFTLTGGCSAACVSSAIYDVMTQAPNQQGAILIGVFSVFLFIASIVAGYASFRRPAWQDVSEHEEKLTLALAKRNGGVLSVAELALGSRMDVDRSRSVLDELVTKHIAEPDVTTEGEIVYRFPAFARGASAGAVGGVSFDFDAETDGDLEESIRQAHFEKHEQGH